MYRITSTRSRYPEDLARLASSAIEQAGLLGPGPNVDVTVVMEDAGHYKRGWITLQSDSLEALDLVASSTTVRTWRSENDQSMSLDEVIAFLRKG